MPYCRFCGSSVHSNARYCAECGNAQYTETLVAHPQTTTHTQTRSATKSRRALWISLALLVGLIVIYSVLNSGSDDSTHASNTVQQAPEQSTQTTSPVPKMTPEQIKALEMYSLKLESMFSQDGYDISVVPYADTHTLSLTSDSFRDPVLREGVAQDLVNLHKELCNLGVWDAEVGYSRGLLSSDVAKHVSLNCPEAKAARIALTEDDRRELASKLNFDNRIHVRVDGTTLVFESAEYFDNSVLRKRFLEFARNQSEKLCAREVSHIRLIGKSYNKTFPVVCN